jgi:hypothetical protein
MVHLTNKYIRTGQICFNFLLRAAIDFVHTIRHREPLLALCIYVCVCVFV